MKYISVDWIVKRTVVEYFYVERASTREEAKEKAVNPYDTRIINETAVRPPRTKAKAKRKREGK